MWGPALLVSYNRKGRGEKKKRGEGGEEGRKTGSSDHFEWISRKPLRCGGAISPKRKKRGGGEGERKRKNTRRAHLPEIAEPSSMGGGKKGGIKKREKKREDGSPC